MWSLLISGLITESTSPPQAHHTLCAGHPNVKHGDPCLWSLAPPETDQGSATLMSASLHFKSALGE